MKYISIYIYLFLGMKMTIHRNLKIYDLDFSLIKITVEMNIFLVKYYLNISPKKSIIYILRSQSLSLRSRMRTGESNSQRNLHELGAEKLN